jgi:hypothetical protein
MQFREQGRKIQCIRSTYNPATKRSDQRVIASFPNYVDEPPAELGELSEAEREELKAWFGARKSAQEASRNKFSSQMAGATLTYLAKAIEAAGKEMTPAEVEAVWKGLHAVTVAMRRHGHKKAKGPKPEAVIKASPRKGPAAKKAAVKRRQPPKSTRMDHPTREF